MEIIEIINYYKNYRYVIFKNKLKLKKLSNKCAHINEQVQIINKQKISYNVIICANNESHDYITNK